MSKDVKEMFLREAGLPAEPTYHDIMFLDHKHVWDDVTFRCQTCGIGKRDLRHLCNHVIDLAMGAATISDDLHVQAFYAAMLCNGTSPALAEMLALQLPPGTKGSDRAFMEGRVCGNQFERTPKVGDYYRSVAKDAGVSTTGKFYSSGLARYPGDPQAWVSGVGDVQRIADKENFGVEGAVNRKSIRGIREPAPPVRMAEDLVQEKVKAIVAANPDAKGQEKKIRKQVIEKHGAQV